MLNYTEAIDFYKSIIKLREKNIALDKLIAINVDAIEQHGIANAAAFIQTLEAEKTENIRLIEAFSIAIQNTDMSKEAFYLVVQSEFEEEQKFKLLPTKEKAILHVLNTIQRYQDDYDKELLYEEELLAIKEDIQEEMRYEYHISSRRIVYFQIEEIKISEQ